MQEIAAEAGISLKTLYANFPGKSELYREIQEVRGAEFVAHTNEVAEAAEPSLGRLEAGVRGYVEFLLAHENFLRIHLREGRAWGLGPPEHGAEGRSAAV